MTDASWPGRVLQRQQNLARSRRFQTETALILGPDGRKSVFKRALHQAGGAHLRRMAANHAGLQSGLAAVSTCPCAMNGELLELTFIEGISLKRQLIQAILSNNLAAMESLLENYRHLVSAFDDSAGTLLGPGSAREIFAGLVPTDANGVKSGNIDQGFDHFIQQGDHWILIDYEWVLGFSVPRKYVLYRAAQLFFQDVPPHVSPSFRLRDMCAFYDIDTADRTVYDQMEASFQRFVRTDTDQT